MYLMSGNREPLGQGQGLQHCFNNHQGFYDSSKQRLWNPAASSALGLMILAFQEDFITLE